MMAHTVSAFNTPGPVLPGRTSICLLVLSWAREVSTRQRWGDQPSAGGSTVAFGVEERRHQGDLAGPEAWAAAVVAHLSELQRLWQRRQGLPGEPRGAGRRLPPRHQLVLDAKRCVPAGSWHTFDGRRPPPTRRDKRPARGAIHDLAPADAPHGGQASLDEKGEVGGGTQAPIGHEHGPWA
jgi:hypothetical protein